jgi:hypothetical protein
MNVLFCFIQCACFICLSKGTIPVTARSFACCSAGLRLKRAITAKEIILKNAIVEKELLILYFLHYFFKPVQNSCYILTFSLPEIVDFN